MKILINATALVERGSYSLIKDFLEQIRAEEDYLKKKDIYLTILVSKEELLQYSSESIKVVLEPYPKKGLFQRLYYERFMLSRVLKEEGAEAYLSLQNTSLYKGKVPQFVLIHQSLHFSGLGFFELELIYIIKYRILMNLFTRFSIKNYDGIITQTQWVKDGIVEKYGFRGEIRVIRPETMSVLDSNEDLSKEIFEKLNTTNTKFLYVTSVEKYKNNLLLIDSVKAYNSKDVEGKKIVLFLTIDGRDDNDIKYLGKVPYSMIGNLYKNVDVLIFPSLMETLGLPLMEAMSLGIPVLAADLPYAREVCGDKGIFFDPRRGQAILAAIEKYMSEYQIKKSDARNLHFEKHKEVVVEKSISYMEFIDYIYNRINKK